MMSHSQRMKDLLEQALEAYSLITGVHKAAEIMPFMDEERFESFVKDIDVNGFQDAIKITDEGLLIDGRNRLCASIVLEKDVRIERFNPSDPLQYVRSKNEERRHLNKEQLAVVAIKAAEYSKYAEEAKQRKGQRTDLLVQSTDNVVEKDSTKSEDKPTKTRDKLADDFGTNSNYVSQAIAVQKHAPELLDDVHMGAKPLKEAAQEARQRKKEAQGQQQELGNKANNEPIPSSAGAMNTEQSDHIETVEINGNTLHIWHRKPKTPSGFNTAGKSIDWAWSTWNPVTGCNHGCPYCYARDIALNERYANAYPKGFEPVFHPYRLDAPKYAHKFTSQEIIREASIRNLDVDEANQWAQNVFVCSMADLFGKWVPDEWILQVFESVKKYNDWKYLFLTKYPQRLQEIGEKLGGSFPVNCWVGTTVDEQKRVQIAQKAFANINATVKWLSLEPLLTNLEFTDLGMFDMVAIGGQSSNSQVSEFQPEWKWIENILWQARQSNTSVYFKENLKCRPKELPF